MTTARPAKAPRNEGQWALGNREPLNPNEEMKKAGAPCEMMWLLSPSAAGRSM